MSEIAIKFENISKEYRLGTIGTGTLSHDLNRWWTMNIKGKEDPNLIISQENDRASKAVGDYIWALRNINFEVKKGDVLGIIGMNGAGKSTLLKILSRVTSPTTGSIKARGRIASLLEVGTGFHPEMTGRENIFMNGSIMGMRKAEIRNKFDEIVSFAGVEKYIDTPTKRYSSGMTVRLGFAIAAHLEPEILVVDEVLAVGDAEFQKKAIGKMQYVSYNEGRTVLLVSHNMGLVSQLCTNGIILKNGLIHFHGQINDAINLYLQDNINRGFYISDGKGKEKKDAYFKEIRILDSHSKDRVDFFHTEIINILFNIKINDNKLNYNLFCIILDRNLKRVFAAESLGIKSKMLLKINSHFLVRGDYSIHAFIHIPKIKQEDIAENVCPFKIFDIGSKLHIHGDYDYGTVFGNYEWIEEI